MALALGLWFGLRRELEGRDAPRGAAWTGLAAYLVAAMAWLMVLVAPVPVWLAWVASVPAAVLTVWPGGLIRLAGGSQAAPHLRRETEVLLDIVGAPLSNITPAHLEALRARVRGLERWRTPATAELIDALQVWAFDRLDGMPVPVAEEAQQRRRIGRLQARLLVPSGGWSPPTRPPQAPPHEEDHGEHRHHGQQQVERLQRVPQVLPVNAQLKSSEDEQGTPQDRAKGRVEDERHERHARHPGGKADEGPHHREEAAHEDRGAAVAGKEDVGPVDLVRADQEEPPVALE
jgi:hypothetical protein